MFKTSLFKERPAVAIGRSLYSAAVAQARRPAFYIAGVADTPEGRFELYTLHMVLILHRLKGQGAEAADVSQAAFDAFVRGLDDGLREMGVGDLSVGKKMRKLGEAFYGRVKSYDAALEGLPDAGPLRSLLERTVLEGGDVGLSGELSAYVADCVTELATQPLSGIMEGQASWPVFQS